MSQPVKSQPKDLTATLLKNNLDELNLSMSKSTMLQPDYSKNTTYKYNEISLTQSQFLTSPTQTMPNNVLMNRPMNWNSNGINAPINWNLQQSTSMWNASTPQNNMNFTTQSENRPNFSGTLQPFMSNAQTNTNISNSSTQDIMDLLS